MTPHVQFSASGRSTRGRRDFLELMSKVCGGEAGLVFVLEASRLSRNSADFQRLLEFCQVTDTLIADADGVYDLRDFNDQLLGASLDEAVGGGIGRTA